MKKYRTQNTDVRTQTNDYKKQKLNLGSEKGIVLIVSLLLLLVATVVGITALSTSTTNVMISGNQRLNEITFSGADSGVSVSAPIINDTAYNKAVSATYSPLIQTTVTDFVNEISGGSIMDSDNPITSPDIQFTLGAGPSAITVSVDVDYLYAAAPAGGAIEFASGYEGLGKGLGGGGAEIYYGIVSVGQGTVGSENSVCAIYRYITK